MNEAQNLKVTVAIIFGIIGSFFGGWNEATIALGIFMLIDYCSGIAVAFFWKRSPKTENGKLSAEICIKGIFKKLMALSLVIIAYRLDILNDSEYIKQATAMALIGYELVSIKENFELAGFTIPKALTDALEKITKKP